VQSLALAHPVYQTRPYGRVRPFFAVRRQALPQYMSFTRREIQLVSLKV
jgi:hypothetical protein